MRLPVRTLRHRNFRLLVAGRTLSTFGSALAPVALAFAVIELTGSPTDLGLVLAATILPQVVLVLAGGVWADRLPRNRVMATADAVSCAAQASIAVLLASGHASIALLVALAAVRGTASAFFQPASQGLVPHTVPAELLSPANALLRLSRNGATIAGTASAGLLVALVGPAGAIGLDAATFGLSALVALNLRLPSLPPPARRSFLGDLRDGWSEVRARTWLLAMTARSALVNAFTVVAFVVLGPFVVDDALGGPAAWGMILAGQAAGMIAAGLVALRVRPRRPLLAASCAMLLVAPAPALLALEAPLVAVTVAAFFAGAGIALGDVLWDTTLQQQVDGARLSRVAAYDLVGSFALIPAGLVLVGPLAAVLGIPWTLALAAAVALAAPLATLLVADVRRLERPEAIPDLATV